MYTPEEIQAKLAGKTRADYDAIDALNQTSAKLLLKAPAKYAHDKANPRKDSKALREGIMTHAAVLDPEAFAKFKPEPEADKRTKEGKEVHAYWASTLQPDDIRCKADEYDNALSYSDAVKTAMARYNIVPVATEVMLKTDYIVPIKGSIDLIAEDGYLYDIKTTMEEATPKGFGRQLIWSDDFKLQAAWYLLLCKLNFGVRPKGFRFLVVEKEAPFLTAVFELHPDLIAEGEALMLSAMKAYEVCKSFNEWPAYPSEVITIARPTSTAPLAPINFA
jgi:hypothetical protein